MSDLLQERNKIAPQMFEYDRLGVTWLPYVMFFQTPNYSSKVVNTDEDGFRFTSYQDGFVSLAEDIADTPKNLLIGSSAAFGVGVSDDAHTIPSLLSKKSDELWINLCGRAFSSTQELLLFQMNLHRLKNVKKVVIMSGVNNFVLSQISDDNSNYGSFFFSKHYETEMNKLNKLSFNRMIAQKLLAPIYGDDLDFARMNKKELFDLIFKKDAKRVTKPRLKAQLDLSCEQKVLKIMERDIFNWKLLCDSMGIEICYALQPFANWIERELSPEEKKIFTILDQHPANSLNVLKNQMNRDKYEMLVKCVSGVCERNQIKFVDMNQKIEAKKADGEWLFTDRVHLTDLGCQIVADILEAEGMC